MFTTAFFCSSQKWKQPKCPTVGDWFNKLWRPTMEYYPPIKRKDKLIPTTPNLQGIMLNEGKKKSQKTASSK